MQTPRTPVADVTYQTILLQELEHKMSAYHSVQQLHNITIPHSLTLYRETIKVVSCGHQLV